MTMAETCAVPGCSEEAEALAVKIYALMVESGISTQQCMLAAQLANYRAEHNSLLRPVPVRAPTEPKIADAVSRGIQKAIGGIVQAQQK